MVPAGGRRVVPPAGPTRREDPRPAHSVGNRPHPERVRTGADRGRSMPACRNPSRRSSARCRCCRGSTRSISSAWRRTSRSAPFPAGTVIIRQGDDHGIGFFVVSAGEASSPSTANEVARSDPGNYFGEVALISDRVRTASVTAATDMTVLVMMLTTSGRSFAAMARSPGGCSSTSGCSCTTRPDPAATSRRSGWAARARLSPPGGGASRAGGRCRPRSRGS